MSVFSNYQVNLRNSHFFHALIGFNQEWSVYEGFTAKRENLISNSIPIISLATGEDYTTDYQNDWAIRGIFMRLKYNFKGKYLFEINSRYDGTSKFPKETRFAYFPSLSLGWRISDEPFMEKTRTVLKDMKFRASYGSLGNQNIVGNYPYITNFGITPVVQYLLNGTNPLGVNAPALVSADLTWEKSSTLNFGFDAQILKKLSLSYDWYNRRTIDMLTEGDKLPAVLGTSVPRRNNAKLETKGWELIMHWRDNFRKRFSYDAGLVLSDYNSTITEFRNNPNKLINNYYTGQNIGEIWGYQTIGLFQSVEEVNASPNQNKLGNNGKWGPGDVRYADLNDDKIIDFGDGTVANPGDMKIIGNTTPRFQFGITGNIEYKDFDFNVLFQGVGKRDFFPTGSYFWGHLNNSTAVGTYDVWNNAWRPENPDAYFPIYKTSSKYNILTQTRYLQSGAYIRLKNLTLGYSLPGLLVKKIKLSKCRFYFSGYNLWEYATLRGNFDPEIIGNLAIYYPMQRSLLFGIEITL